MKNKLKIASTFSGIGAYEKACINLGLDTEIEFYCELDKTKSKAYSLLYNVSEDKNLIDATSVNLNKICDNLDYYFYSPPCQSYSKAGKQEGIKDIRGTLFWDSLKIINKTKPKYCIMENVDNLPNKFTEIFEDMLKCLDNEGYYNYWKVINAKDFIPQNRNRVFVVSIRKDIVEEDYIFNFPVGNDTRNWYDFIDVSEGRSLTERQKRMINFVKENNSEDLIKIEGDVQFEQATIILRQSGLRFQNNRYVPTLCARMGTGGGNFPILAYKGVISGLSVRQAFKLMGFEYEDSDLLTNNKISQSNQYIMAGDSIVVPILEEIIKELINIHNQIN